MSNFKNCSDKLNALNSVGIDIGTTTMHLVFSQLELSNQASATQIPQLTITGRTVTYESPIYLTPLKGDGTIDGAGAAEIIEREYKKAQFVPADIDCGAVIITGETARLRNAEEVLLSISAMAGDFVAASAGPELESILAGRGSGVFQHSLETGRTICNIDIGGGTTNLAVFQSGRLVETACLRIGGRCLQFDSEGRFVEAAQSGKRLSEMMELSLRNCSAGDLAEFGNRVAELLLDLVTGAETAPADLLISKAMPAFSNIDEYWFSGGVAELMRNPGENKFPFKDLGWFLATGLNRALEQAKLPYRIAGNPVRATVLGAGSYSIQLSGNTVSLSTNQLPLRGIPLIRPFRDLGELDSCDYEIVSQCLRAALSPVDLGLTRNLVAIVLDLPPAPRFKNLKIWAESLAFAFQNCEIAPPYILISKSDSAMALGQLLRGRLEKADLVVLDGIEVGGGDYIDIGKPLSGGGTIPVTVKSLIFAN